MTLEEVADDPGDAVVPLRDGGVQNRHAITSSSPGRTLLPSPIARAVSLATQSTSFALRVGTTIGGYSLGAAKLTTLSSLQLGRGMLEAILSAAGKDVMGSSRSELGRENAESTLERSLENLHQTMTQVVFWTTAGFHFTGAIISKASEYSQLLLSVLDQFFGSTDSSKAIASIITLIRREFQNPATGAQGERVGVMDILLGLCGLAYLQNRSRRILQEEAFRLGHEEIVWDVVVLNDGERVDVHEDSLYGVHKGRYRNSVHEDKEEGIVEVIEQHGANESSSEDETPEITLKRQIMGKLPNDAKVSISTATHTTKIITVEIQGAPDVPLLAPPGADLVESGITTPDTFATGVGEDAPIYRVVYRMSRNKLRNTIMQQSDGGEKLARVEAVEDAVVDDGIELAVPSSPERPPPLPPKPTATLLAAAPIIQNGGPSASVSDYQQRANHLPELISTSSWTPLESQIPSPKTASEHAANQKKSRQPLGASRRSESSPMVMKMPARGIPSAAKDSDTVSMKPPEKRSGLRNVLKKGSVPAFANLLTRDGSSEGVGASGKQKSSSKPPWGSNKHAQQKAVINQARAPVPDRSSSMIPAREAPRPPQRGNPNYFSSRDLGAIENDFGLDRSPSRSSFVAVHERRRDSTISQTDTFSIHSFGSRPNSPTMYRTEYKNSSMSKSKSGNDIADLVPPSPPKHHQRAKSHLGSLYSPSIYTLKTAGSQTSLVLSSYHQKGAYSDSEAVDTLRRTGKVSGMFPDFHILRNITRYSRYASAAYGSTFLKYMGIAKEMPVMKALEGTNPDVQSFAHHTELPPNSILLHSFVDPQGGSDSTGKTDTGVPLVHTISVDAESRAVVLSCRGTLGFEDVLADMMCDYDDLLWRGKTYKVHKGIHASARRLLFGGDGRVLVTLKEALEEFPEYGLVLCGHSLGGAVTALLGAMLAEPSTTGTAFVTSVQHQTKLITDGHTTATDPNQVRLPSGRPIHVYAYGPPATMSPSFQKATRGLITSTVHGNDLVPHLSLGVLHDLQAVALAFKTDNSDAKAEVRRRVWDGLQSGLADKWYNNAPKTSSDEEVKWAYTALKTLRVSMMNTKLLPPGEVFTVESTPVLRRDAFGYPGEQVGRPATRIVLKYIRDVETRFRELRFGSSMLLDHTPGRYEDALRRLTLGVVEH